MQQVAWHRAFFTFLISLGLLPSTPQGKIFSLSFCPESPYLLVAGGDNVQPLIIDAKGFSQVCLKYGLPAPEGEEEDEVADD